MRRAGEPLKVGLIGWGSVGQRLGALIAEHAADDVRIVVVAVRDATAARPRFPAGAKLVKVPEELADLDLDMVIEAAGRAAVPIWGEAALRAAGSLVIASTSALCDDALLARLRAIACDFDGQIIVPAGALGGVGALRAASVLPLDSVVHTIVKPPRAWRGTPAEAIFKPDSLVERREFFRGTAREVAALYPKNANVAVITALAGIGLDRTIVCLVAEPTATRNAHSIEARGAFGKLRLEIENEPLACNPKSSEMTALSLFGVLRNEQSNLVV